MRLGNIWATSLLAVASLADAPSVFGLLNREEVLLTLWPNALGGDGTSSQIARKKVLTM